MDIVARHNLVFSKNSGAYEHAASLGRFTPDVLTTSNSSSKSLNCAFQLIVFDRYMQQAY